MRFLDFVYVKPYFTSNPSDKSITMLLEDHIGLKITISNRGIKNLNTRHRFMVNCLTTLENRIMAGINKKY
jgi:hypothetical protein